MSSRFVDEGDTPKSVVADELIVNVQHDVIESHIEREAIAHTASGLHKHFGGVVDHSLDQGLDDKQTTVSRSVLNFSTPRTVGSEAREDVVEGLRPVDFEQCLCTMPNGFPCGMAIESVGSSAPILDLA